MRRLVLLAAICTSLMAVSATRVRACSCVPEHPVLTLKQQVVAARQRSDAVFSARIVALRNENEGGRSVTYAIEVIRVWKGDVPRTTIVSTGSNSAMCGYAFSVGETYLIYAGGGNDSTGFSTTHCTRTARLSETSDTRHLGKGRKPKM